MTVDLKSRTDSLVAELNAMRGGTHYIALIPPFNLLLVLQGHHDNLRQLTAQKSENESVKKEFDVLEAEGAIWKLTGPLLVRQERADANANVEKRIEFINSEMIRVEEVIKKYEADFEERRKQLVEVQSQIQSQQA